MRKCVLIVSSMCWHTIVSIEFLFSLLAISVYSRFLFIRKLFESLVISNELRLTLMGITIAISVWVFKETRKIWWPEVRLKSILLDWPGYFRLKCCCIVACFYAFGCSALAIIGTVFKDSIPSGLGLYFVITSMTISFFDGASCWLASLKIRQMLESTVLSKV